MGCLLVFVGRVHTSLHSRGGDIVHLERLLNTSNSHCDAPSHLPAGETFCLSPRQSMHQTSLRFLNHCSTSPSSAAKYNPLCDFEQREHSVWRRWDGIDCVFLTYQVMKKRNGPQKNRPLPNIAASFKIKPKSRGYFAVAQPAKILISFPKEAEEPPLFPPPASGTTAAGHITRCNFCTQTHRRAHIVCSPERCERKNS